MTGSITSVRKLIAACAMPMLGAAALVASPAALGQEDPYTAADDTWITLSGTVESTDADEFMLDYGDGIITVEFDDGDRDADAYKLLAGDKVTVTGKVDDDFIEMTKIEASGVYIDNLGTTFFASAVDEETSDSVVAQVDVPVVVSSATIIGTVEKTGQEEFVVDSGLSEIRVDTESMPYDPLDNEGFQKIDAGDRVKVSGRIDSDMFSDNEFVADAVVTLDE